MIESLQLVDLTHLKGTVVKKETGTALSKELMMEEDAEGVEQGDGEGQR